MTRNGPLAYYRGPDDMPEGPEYELARRFADELGVKLKMTPLRSYAEIYAALTSGHAHLAAAGLKVPSQSVPGIEFGPAYQRVREHLIYRRGRRARARWLKSAVAIWKLPREVRMRRPCMPHATCCPISCGWKTPARIPRRCSTGWPTGPSITPSLIPRNSRWPTMCIRSCASHLISRQPVSRLGREHPRSWFLRDLGGYFGHLNGDGELAAIVQRYYGRSEDLEFVGARGFHAALAEPPAAVEEMV